MKNQFGVEHAFPGICSCCYTEVAEFNGSKNGKPIVTRYLPNYFGLVTVLDDGSQMTITLCSDCAQDLKKKDYKKIMTSEIAGWEYELTNCLRTWTKEKKQEYRNRYFKRFIKNHLKGTKARRKSNGTR
jgi:hypothetical protein